MIISLVTTIFLLCPVTIIQNDGGYFDSLIEEEYWVLELPRSEVRLNRDCKVLKGRYT